MDLSEKIMPPAAMYEITGLKADAFRGQKSRGFYKGCGIVADGGSGKFSRYSPFEIAAVQCADKLKGFGVELQDAASCVASIFPRFPDILEKARREAARANADFVEMSGVEQPYRTPAHWALSARFLLEKVAADEGGGERWSLTEIDSSRPVQEQLALRDVVIVIDVGRIIGSVVEQLIRGGAMSAAEI